MNSFIRSRIVKSQTVEVSIPRLVENKSEDFQHLGGHLAVIRNVEESDTGVISFGSSIEELGEQDSEKTRENELFESRKKAEAEADEILAKAQAEAEKILSKAKAEAAELKQKISEEVTAKAQNEGHEKGFTQGHAEGYAKGHAEGERETADKLQQTHNLFKLVQNAAREEFTKAEDDLLHLSVKIAERVVRASLKIKPELIFHQIQALSLFPQEREDWRLHVSPEDFAWLRKSDTETQLNLSYVADDTLNSGDSFLECPEGIFDARLEVQLSHLEQLLREELSHEGLEQTSR